MDISWIPISTQDQKAGFQHTTVKQPSEFNFFFEINLPMKKKQKK